MTQNPPSKPIQNIAYLEIRDPEGHKCAIIYPMDDVIQIASKNYFVKFFVPVVDNVVKVRVEFEKK